MWKLKGSIAALILLATVCAYWPVFRAGFVDLDDGVYVFENKVVQAGLTAAGIKWAFTTGTGANWHPVTWLSHMADCQFYAPGPSGQHATNLALHTATSLLLFFWFVRFCGSLWKSALAAGIFALHPVHVESVAWISERKDVLSGFFFLLTLWAYGLYVERRRNYAENLAIHPEPKSRLKDWFDRGLHQYLLALGLFVLGLMSKPMLVTVPFVLLLLDYWPLKRDRILNEKISAVLLEKVPFLFFSITGSIVTYVAQQRGNAFALGQHLNWEERLSNAVVSYVCYLRETVWPLRLVPFYPYESHSVGIVLAAALFMFGLTAVFFYQGLKSRAWLVGWMWFCGMLVPVIGIVQAGVQARADRYMYLPLIGLLFLAIWGPSSIKAVNWKSLRITAGAAGVLLAALAVLTFQQAALWDNSDRLFGYTIRVVPDNPVALHSYGLSQLRQGRLKEASELFRQAIRIWPHFWEAHVSLGTAAARQGATQEALQSFRAAAQLRPEQPLAHFDCAVLLEGTGQMEEALREYSETLRLDPTHVDARLGLGRTQLALHEPEAALSRFIEVLQAQPTNKQARLCAAKALAAQGRLENAQAELATAIGVPADCAEVHFRLAEDLSALGRWPDAFDQYREALKRDPESVAALNNLAWFLAAHSNPAYRNGEEAVGLAEKACELTYGEQPALLGTLAAAYAEARRFDAAEMTAQKAIQLAQKAGAETIASKNCELLELYRVHKPYHDSNVK